MKTPSRSLALGALALLVLVSGAAATAQPWSIWDDATLPASPYENDGQAIEVGVKFRAAEDGYVIGLRFYKGAANTGNHVGHLWSSAGVLLATAPFTNETASGWQTVLLDEPVAVTANTTYVASYHSPSGGFAFSTGYFGAAVVNGPLRALASGEDGGNAVYNYGASSFPTQSANAANYWADVVFDTVPPTVTGFENEVPANPDVSDGQPIELGVKFSVDQPGEVTALRFYKGASNGGTHTGNLWSETGTLLATATYTNETASGWQEVALPTPVAVEPGHVYVASYHSASGGFAITGAYFNDEVVRAPLRFPASGVVGGNGVYAYGPSSFPTGSFNAANYWADLRFDPAPPVDATPPTITLVTPTDGATHVATSTNATARASEALDPASITPASFELRGPGGALVAAGVSWSETTNTAVLDPSAALAISTIYTATLHGGPAGVHDVAGNALAADVVWSFTTAGPPPPPPHVGPGGPILVVARPSDPFGRYLAEILRTEGLNEFDVVDLNSLTAGDLASHAVVLLAPSVLAPAQATMLSSWVDDGGNLVALRPDAQLAPLLGITPAAGTLANAYLAIDTNEAPGQGLVADSIQFHGFADRFTLAGARAVATLWSDATTPTANPAVTLRTVGTSGGHAAAFTYDLARSVVFTRQGNPVWIGQERDGISPIRSDDLFFGAGPGETLPDWSDLTRVAIPQADVQQRLLANLVRTMLRDVLPLPRFWYLPSGHRAAVVLTGDNHGCCDGTRQRFQANQAVDPPTCSVADWECVRSTSYIYPGGGMSVAEAAGWDALGFEIGVHVNTGCSDWTPASLESFYSTQIGAFTGLFPSLPAPVTNRTHCIVWSDWSTQASVAAAHGIRFDTNYYYWPPGWVLDRPGFFTGSGIPMRFAALDGTMIDVFQAVTQITDESNQNIPHHIAALLDGAQGPNAHVAVVTANMHTDGAGYQIAGAAAIVAAAQARGVPVVSARQMLEWTDGRNASSFENLAFDGTHLDFDIVQAGGARNLRAMLPHETGALVLATLTRDGAPIPVTAETIHGVAYTSFDATSGSYVATYDDPPEPPGPPCLADATPADFAAGTTDAGARVASDGTVVLATTVAETFAGPSLPSGWSSAEWEPGSTAVTSGGALVVDGARAYTDALFGPGRTLEFTATFGAETFQHMGFGVTYNEAPFIIFSTGTNAGSVKARTLGPAGFLETVVPGAVGVPHQYRIDWLPALVEFRVDGVLVATHAQAIPDSLRPIASDLFTGGASLSVDSIAMSPYLSPGRFSSRVFDAGALATWGAVAWQSILPGGTSTNVSLRAGNTPAPDASWSAFASIASPGGTAGVAGRYAQYAVDLTTLDGSVTPRFDSIEGACVIDPDDCTPSSCQNGGTCHDGLASFTCTCPPGFIGATCQIPTDGDADADGILDEHETGTGIYVSPTDTGTSATDADSDDDGFADGVEIARGSDPNDDDSTPPPAIGADVYDLGDWSQLYVAERALGVAPDGSAVAGGGDRGQGPEGFVWALTSGIVPVGDLAGGAFDSEIAAMTNGGAIAVGTGTTDGGVFAVRRDAGGLVSLGDLPGGAAASRATGVSADGAIVVGAGTTAAGEQAFRWTSGGLVPLGHLPGGGAASEASAVSATGDVVVGTSDSAAGTQAFLWTTAQGMLPLGDIPGGPFESHAFDVSSDGFVVVGAGASMFGPAAIVWNGGRISSLGDLPGGAFASVARATSTNGRVIVGSSTTAAGAEAFVWTRSSGMRRLADILTIERGIDLSGWERLVSADDVSDDGVVVVGRGIAGGVERAFVAVLESDCSNGTDDDADGVVDYPLDPQCTSPIDVSERSDCEDGYDNDGDGGTDWPADPTCYSGGRENAQCSNGVDDDGDGLIDWPTDTRCSSSWDDDELANPACGFGAELVVVLGMVGALRKRRERVS